MKSRYTARNGDSLRALQRVFDKGVSIDLYIIRDIGQKRTAFPVPPEIRQAVENTRVEAFLLLCGELRAQKPAFASDSRLFLRVYLSGALERLLDFLHLRFADKSRTYCDSEFHGAAHTFGGYYIAVRHNKRI